MGTVLRLMIIAAIVWFIYSLVRRTLFPSSPRVEPPPTAPLMKQCAQCGVHIPETESTQSQGHYFCCEAHRDHFLKLKP